MVNIRKTSLKRETKETTISCTLDLDASTPIDIETSVPFFNHLLHAMSFHGNFSLVIRATGDVDIDAHHLLEDCGLVIGDALASFALDSASLARFGHAVIPMDEALSEVAIDICGRSTCSYRADFPQKLVGNFDTSLLREFLNALAGRAKISLHAVIHAGENSHHMAESLFKALGKAIAGAYRISGERKAGMSTKGTLA
jgi:imidazoleglycerol-phosphate dehydratase